MFLRWAAHRVAIWITRPDPVSVFAASRAAAEAAVHLMSGADLLEAG